MSNKTFCTIIWTTTQSKNYILGPNLILTKHYICPPESFGTILFTRMSWNHSFHQKVFAQYVSLESFGTIFFTNKLWNHIFHQEVLAHYICPPLMLVFFTRKFWRCVVRGVGGSGQSGIGWVTRHQWYTALVHWCTGATSGWQGHSSSWLSQ